MKYKTFVYICWSPSNNLLLEIFEQEPAEENRRGEKKFLNDDNVMATHT